MDMFQSMVVAVYRKSRIDNISQMAAALAYSSLFAVIPLLVVSMTALGIFMNDSEIANTIMEEVQLLAHPNVALLFETLVDTLLTTQAITKTQIASIIFLFFGATSAINHLQNSLNIIFHVEAKKRTPLVARIRQQFVVFLFFGAFGILVSISFIFNTLLSFFGEIILDSTHLPYVQIATFHSIGSFLTTFILVTLMYRSIPEGYIAWNRCIKGALFTAVCLVLGKFALTLYVDAASLPLIYEATGSVFIFLFWVYYSAFIFFIGAELISLHGDTRWEK